MKQFRLDTIARDWRLQAAVAGILAVTGFIINQWQLVLSWGGHISFGNALIYAFIRHLRPVALISAIAVAALQLIMQGQIPWIWALITVEALIIVSFYGRSSPILIDLCFWIFVSIIIIIAINFLLIGFSDQLQILIGAQALASVACIIIGEVAYTIYTIALGISYGRPKDMSIDSLIVPGLMASVGIPTILTHEFLFQSQITALVYSHHSLFEIFHQSMNSNLLLSKITYNRELESIAWLQIFRIFLFIAILTISGISLSYWVHSILRRIVVSARGIGDYDVTSKYNGCLSIKEIDEVSDSFSAVGSELALLSRDRRRLAAITNDSPVVLYAIEIENDRLGRPTYISPSAESMFGWSKAEIYDQTFWPASIHPDDLVQWTASFSSLQQGLTRRAEYRLRRSDGKYLWVYDTLSIEFNPVTGRPEGVGVIIDITERKIAATQLIQADKMASLGRVLTGVTHEINQPLNFMKVAIVNLRHLIAKAPQDLTRVNAKLDQIAANVDHAAEIVSQMQVFGRVPLNAKNPAPFSEVIASLKLIIGSQMKLDHISLDTTRCMIGAEMIDEPKLLGQVLLNLLVNGRDAIIDRYATGDGQPGKLVVSAVRRDADLVITVDDNGTGIPDAVLSNLFEPFFTTKSSTQGTGLGLSISYGIVHDMGGTLTADNIGHGARFTVTIPAMRS
jgi:PAS domain S-box-containing protein